MKKGISEIIIMTAVILSSLLLAGCGEKVKPGTSAVKREAVTGITVETVKPSQVDRCFETSGTVAAKTISAVAGRMMGTVTSLRVKEGDRVSAGQLLLTVDDSDVKQKVRAASEGYNEAVKGLEAAKENRNLSDITYRRYKKLYDEKALSGQELDQIETQMKVADIDYQRAEAAVARAGAGLSEAKVYHGFTRVVSPVSGIVTEKKIEVGSMAVPGAPLLTVEDNSAYRIEVSGDESLVGKIRPGMNASVFIESLNRQLNGRISEVVPSVDPMSRTFVVKIAIKSEGLRNGLYARVSIPVGKKETILVPGSAVVEKGELAGLYVVGGDSVIRYRLVKTGRSYGDNIEILSGVNPGDSVIVGGVDRAIDGGIAATPERSGK